MIVFLVLTSSVMGQETDVVYAYNYDVEDSVLSGLVSIRGCYFHDDPFGDGKSAVLLSNYFDAGHVNLFVSAGNDNMELVWTSPKVAQEGEGSTPRYPLFGDLDNDGVIEIIYQSNNNGVFIYEWDGTPGSYNFGDGPAQTIVKPYPSVSGNFEYAEVLDIDNDGLNELVHVQNASSSPDDDGYFVISAIGEWTPGEPGFSSFTAEYTALRNNFPDHGLDGGNPYGFFSVQFDGVGNKELLSHTWDNKSISPIRVTDANTYEMAETANGKGFIRLSDVDDVSLFGAIAFDIDDDGREELYMPTYNRNPEQIHMIHYEDGQSTAEIDESNVFLLDMNSGEDTNLVFSATFGYGYGDIDNDSKPNLYFSGTLGMNVVTAEFQGGDKLDEANWEYSLVYAGDSTIISKITITDSSGVLDTVISPNTAFVSKMWARNTDFDKDGKEDMILVYQSANDSISTIMKTWNGSSYDLDTTKTLNLKRYSFRILEQTIGTGIEVKDITFITPKDYKLEQNYPNPFNPTTTIRFNLPLDKQISLVVYDMLGREVKTLLANQEFKSGSYEVTWDATNSFGSKVASGNYIATLKFGNFTKSIKMMLLK